MLNRIENFSHDEFVAAMMSLYIFIALAWIVFVPGKRVQRTLKLIPTYVIVWVMAELGGLIALPFNAQQYGWVIGAIIGLPIGYLLISQGAKFAWKAFKKAPWQYKFLIIAATLFLITLLWYNI